MPDLRLFLFRLFCIAVIVGFAVLIIGLFMLDFHLWS
jgi:hypothetical protein